MDDFIIIISYGKKRTTIIISASWASLAAIGIGNNNKN